MVNQLEHVGQTIYDVEANSSGEVWATGNNKILYSSDSGNTWTDIDFFDINTNLLHIAPFSSTHFLVAGDQAHITSDQGQTWDLVPEITSINSKYSFQETVILNSEDKGLHYSADAGLTWENITPENYDPLVAAINFISSSIGYASDTSGNLLKTIDGGQSWSIMGDAPFEIPIEVISFKNENEGYVELDQSIYHTMDSGMSWTLFTDDSHFSEKLFATETGLYELYSSRIRHYNPNGSWYYLVKDDVNDNQWTYDYCEVENVHYAAGIGMVLRKEIEQPVEDWVDLTPGPNNGFQQMAINGDKIFLTGHTKFQYSEDYGLSFVENKVDGFAQDREILIDENGDFYTCDGSIRRSTNNGIDWEYLGPGRAIHKFQDGRLFVSNQGILVSTIDFGENFETIFETTNSTIQDVYFYDDEFGWLTTNSNKSYRSLDGGQTWEEIIQLFRSPTEIQFINREVGYGIDDFSSFLFKSVDGGTNWDPIQLADFGVNIRLTSLVFVDEQNGYISGEVNGSRAGVVYATEDGGQSWSILQLEYNTFYDLIYDQEKETLWAAGLAGKLYNFKRCESLQPTLELDDNRLSCSDQSDIYKWYLNGEFYLETTESFIDVFIDGAYTVYIQGEEECTSKASDPINFITSNSYDYKNQILVLAYPNPNDGNFVVNVNAFSDPLFKVFQLDGSEVKHDFRIMDNELHINGLPKGVYFIKIFDQDSEAIVRVIAL